MSRFFVIRWSNKTVVEELINKDKKGEIIKKGDNWINGKTVSSNYNDDNTKNDDNDLDNTSKKSNNDKDDKEKCINNDYTNKYEITTIMQVTIIIVIKTNWWY